MSELAGIIPLLFLVQHLLVASYLHVVVVTVWFWDTLISLVDEVRAFRVAGRRMTLPDMAYIFSRILTGGTVLSVLTYAVTPYVGCDSSAHVIAWFGTLATPLNTSLFLVRADAVFKQNKKWRLVLTVLWLSTFSTFTTPFSFFAAPFQIGGYCPVAKVERMGAAGPIAVAIFDTAVFVSMTYKILSMSRLDKHDGWIRLFLRGTGQVSRTLLMTGQLYYFPVITVNTIVMVVMLSPVEPQYQTVALVADIVFQNVMACRVFRLLRLEILCEDAEEMLYSLDLSPSQSSTENIALAGL